MSKKQLSAILFLLGISCIQSEETINHFKFNSNKTSCPMLSDNCHMYVAVKNPLKLDIKMLKRYYLKNYL